MQSGFLNKIDMVASLVKLGYPEEFSNSILEEAGDDKNAYFLFLLNGGDVRNIFDYNYKEKDRPKAKWQRWTARKS